LVPVATKVAQEVLKLPDPGRMAAKDFLRGELGTAWGDKGALERDAHQIWGRLTDEGTVKALKAVMARLGKPKGPAKM
jgi:hypothetical protein